jgi:subtilase family serine protease
MNPFPDSRNPAFKAHSILELTVHSLLKPVAFLLTLGVALSAFSQNKAANRITQAIDDRETTQLRGNVHGFLQRATDQGRTDGGIKLEGVSLIFKRTAAQDAAVEKLLAEQQNPSSPNYHKWLTPERYADRFGLSADDMNKVVAWLQTEGFTVSRVARGRTEVFFSGTVSLIETVFRTEFHNYVVNGERHFANSVQPAVPASLAGVVAGLNHLDDFLPKSRLRNHIRSPQAHFNLAGQHVVAPADFATIYDVPSAINGTGQSIVIVGQSAIYTAGTAASTTYPDIDAFRSTFGLPARTATNFATPILVPGSNNPGIVPGDVDESDLDLEWSAGVARGAKIIFIYAGSSGGGAFGAIQYAIDNNTAPIISSSYGLCELNFTIPQLQQLVTLGQQANTQGQTVVAASGDTGPADCETSPALPAQGGLAVDVPAAMPYVTGVGGTEFGGDVSNPSQYWGASGAALSYIPEIVWNDTTLVNQLDTTGGGASAFFSKPDWQAGTGVPSDGARDVPDIALGASNEHDPYVFCTGGNTSCSMSLAGGTSFGAPTFAGVVAILNQKIGVAAQGNVNPILYKVFSTTPNAFHDITNGDNIVPCGAGTPNCPSSGRYGHSAGVGYDQVTGLGTLDVNNLANAWAAANPGAADFHLYGEQSTISAPGGGGTSTITVDARNGYSGTVTFTCMAPTAALIGCTVGGPVTLGGGTTTGSVTLNITTKAKAALEPGSAPLWLGGSGTLMVGALVFGIPARRRRLGIALTLITVACIAAAVGCGGSSSGGGGSPGTPVGTYTVSVTASDGTTSHTTNVAVAVQ